MVNSSLLRKQLVYTELTILDLKNASFWEITASLYDIVKVIVEMDETMFPAILFKSYLINAPLWTSGAWAIISLFADSETLEKYTILGHDFLETIQKDIPLDQIPSRYGGTCQVNLELGL